MKTLFTLTISFLFFANSYSQPTYEDFEDGKLNNWTNFDGSTTLLTVDMREFPFPYNQYLLNKECDGSNGPVGEMAIINTEEWTGDYHYQVLGEGTIRNIDWIELKNENDFDLHIRYGFKGANDYIVVTTNPIIVPANSDWNVYSQYFAVEFPEFQNLTIINDTGTLPWGEVFNNVNELFADVVEFRIFHNENIEYNGDIVTGTMKIDNIESLLLLDVGGLEKIEVGLFPNPVKDEVTFKFAERSSGTITFYNILGEEVLSEEFSSLRKQINLSELKSGVYIANIKTEKATITKKVIKH